MNIDLLFKSFENANNLGKVLSTIKNSFFNQISFFQVI